ncbi:DNA-binding response OmpR family regulator [Streptomyces sp. 3330]|uniref:response regulator transcription factor n=1 Tax=Streptomyces sp. 3330 TaxID=2817755 RepID=UPI002855275C|nr:response regulator transcription factor [Streptomyces sp. 3330]MDR6973729.1 DNA-binding response OmpR family regulator [Streptomyces sp. 3330]
MGVRVLLIEDDRTIAEPLVEGLGNFGLSVRHVATGDEGLRGPYGDVVLLDLGLPDIDGIDVCRGIRQTSDVPIIILSARGEEADRVLGLELGADDYLAKPFSMRELVARVRAVTRRTHRGLAESEFTGQEPVGGESFAPAAPAAPPLAAPPLAAPPLAAPAVTAPAPGAAAGPLVVDRRTRQVWVGEETVTLTPKEFELLALLTEDPGAVYSRQQILDRVWDPHYQGPTKTLDVHVATLRRKLGNSAWIQTLRGVGFRLAVHTTSPSAGQPYEPPASAPPAPAPPAYAPPAYEPSAHETPAYQTSAYAQPVHEPHAYDSAAYR